MAYRDLNFGDLVRIVSPSSPFHGRNATVLDVDGYGLVFSKKIYKVQIASSNGGPSVVNWFKDKELLVRDAPNQHIVDGRIDHEAKEAFEYKLAQQRFREKWEERREELEPCGTCPCCEAHNR